MNETEEAIKEFLDYCDGKIELSELPESENPIAKVEFDTYGDWIYYKDGTKEYRSIGD